MVSDCLLVASCCHCCFYSFSASVVLLLGLLPPFCTRLEGLEGRAAFLSNPKCGDKGETGCWAPGGWLASCWHPSALHPPHAPWSTHSPMVWHPAYSLAPWGLLALLALLAAGRPILALERSWAILLTVLHFSKSLPGALGSSWRSSLPAGLESIFLAGRGNNTHTRARSK